MSLNLHEKIILAFFPDARQARITPINDGLINETWKAAFQTDAGERQVVLQRINTQLFREPQLLMENFEQIAAHLSGRPDYPLGVLQPFKTAAGELFFTAPEDQSAWRVLPYFENSFAPTALPGPEQARRAAHAYGLFLTALRDFPVARLYVPLPGFHDTHTRFEHFRAVVAADPVGRLAEVRPAVTALLDAEYLSTRVRQGIQSGELPLRVTHNDTKAGNVLLHTMDERAVAVIDWDTVMPGALLSDYGDMVRTFVPDRYEDAPAEGLSIRKSVWEALDDGFLSATRHWLSPTERDLLHWGAAWIASEQALRFLTDYLSGDTYYKIKYPTHNLVRAHNQLALLQALLAEMGLG